MCSIAGIIVLSFVVEAQRPSIRLVSNQHLINPLPPHPSRFHAPPHALSIGGAGYHSMFPLQGNTRSFSGKTPSLPEGQEEAAPVSGKRALGAEASQGDLEQASAEDLTSLSPGDLAAILRSDETWRYARLLERRAFLDFQVDEEGSTKELPITTEEVKKVEVSDGEKRMLGEPVSEKDLKEGNSDLKGLAPDDLVAVLRSDGVWKYGKLVELVVVLDFEVDNEGRVKELEFPGGLLPSALEEIKPIKAANQPALFDQNPSTLASISAVLLVGVLVGSGAILAAWISSWSCGALTTRQKPLLAA